LTVSSSPLCIILQARHLGACSVFFFFNSRVQTFCYYKGHLTEVPVIIIFFFVGTLFIHQGRVFRKPVNTNPGLKVNCGNNFSSTKLFSIAYVLCSLRILMLKTEGQKILTKEFAEMLQK